MRVSTMAATLLLTAPSLPDAAIVGTIRNADTGEPVAGAVVTLTDLDRLAVSDSLGRYAIHSVLPGPQHLMVRRLGYSPRTLHALVPASGNIEINVLLQPHAVVLGEVKVRPPVALRGAEPDAADAYPDREISIAAMRNHPLTPEPDAFLALSGGDVAISQEMPAGVHLRGGASHETGYLLDGIPVFSPYHTGGAFSAWNPDAIERVTESLVSREAGGAEGLSGTVAAFTRSPRTQFGAQGSLGTSQARATFDGPLGHGGAGFLISARAAFPGFIAPDREASYLQGDASDILARIVAPLFGGELSTLAYHSDNETSTVAVQEGDGWGPSQAIRNSFVWSSRSVGTQWRRSIGAARITATAWSAVSSASARWNPDSAPAMDMAAHRHDEGIAAGLERKSREASTHAVFRVQRSGTDYRVLQAAGAELPVAFRARVPIVSSALGHSRNLGAGVSTDLALEILTASAATYGSPRARLRWNLAQAFTLSAEYARTRQFAQSLRNPESVVGTVFPADLYLGAGRGSAVPAARADHGVVAAEFRPRDGARLGVQGYVRRSAGLLLVAPRTADPFSTGSFVTGAGRVHGLAIDAALARPRYGVLFNYGWQRVRLTYGDSTYRPTYSAEHAVESGIIVFPSVTSSVRLGAVGAVGRRVTPPLGSFDWEACNVLDRGCEFGGSPRHATDALGRTRLPLYLRIDLAARKHWHVRRGDRDLTIAAFAVVTNLLGRANVFMPTREAGTGEPLVVLMRPRAPLVVGLDWRL